MKKIILISVSLIYCFICKAQQIVINDNVLKISTQQQIKKINKEEIASFIEQKFNNSTTILNSLKSANPNNFYVVDNILITINYGSKKFEENYPEILKKGLDAMNHRDATYKSTIEKIDNNTVLITNDKWKGIGYYYYYCFNSTSTANVRGSMKYNEADEQKATAILNDLVKNIQFKVQ